MISLAVLAAGWMVVLSPGDYAILKFPPLSRHSQCRVENGLEGYHLSNLHYETLGNITPTRLCEKIPGGEGYTAYKSHYPPDFPQRKPYHDDITEEEKRYSMMLCVYPSHVVGLTPNGIVYTCVRPCSVDKVEMRWGVATFGQKPTRKRVKEMVALYDAVIAEDRGQLEQLWRMNRHFPANLQIHGNRIYIAPPRELHSLPSPPMTRLWRADHVRKAIWQRFPPSRHTSPAFSTLPSISSAYAGTGLRRRSSIKAKIFWNKIFDTATSASWNVT